MPKVFIIILNFNGWPDTEECLESLAKIDYPNFEVILIDNGSEKQIPPFSVIPAKAGIQAQESGSRVTCPPCFARRGGREPGMTNKNDFTGLKIRQICNEKNIGFAGGNNQGIKLALSVGADYILLLNNDTAVEPDFLTKLIEASEANKEYGILGPVIYDYKERKKIQFAGGKINWSRTRGEHMIVIPARFAKATARRAKAGIHAQESGSRVTCPPCFARRGGREPGMTDNNGNLTETDYITGCCLLIKREVIEKNGFISEDYFLYYEDTDWNMRSRQAGYQCGVVPGAKIYHKGSSSSTEFSYPYIYYHTRNGLIFGSRFGFPPLIYLISGWIFLKQLIKLAIGYKRQWARPVIRGVFDFWRGKKGKLAGFY